MELKDVKNLPWKHVTDWSKISTRYSSYFNDYYIYQADIDAFVENVYRDIANTLSIPYELLYPILKQKNQAFYAFKKNKFKYHKRYQRDEKCLIELFNMLKVPEIRKNNETVTDNVTKCLGIFKELSDSEKIVFLQEIGNLQTEETEMVD